MGRPFQIEPSKRVIELYLNKKYNYLTVTSFSHRIKSNKGSRYYFNCLCECGNNTVAFNGYLKIGHTKSCGCLKTKPENWSGNKRVFEGKSTTRLHRIWSCIAKRCNNPLDGSYARYGGRGISVCKEWSIFNVFEQWALQNGYDKTLSIDRVDNDGNYEPSNCRWATSKQQANNRRSNKFIEADGERLTLAQWSIKMGGNPTLVWSRLKIGWDEIKAATTPLRGTI